ncbi:MAG: carotenoid biosynthesis protein [Chloroflexi bacterium]|nr:MAG: carotenoid biosynthesis protein [Chloroflexota bacterium]
MHEIWNTFGGRWYVTLFGTAFAVCAARHLGWRRTIVYAVVAVGIGALAENCSVWIGVPYTKYAFNPSFRGNELYVGDVPLFVPLSYTFSGYFAYAAARLVTSGPWRTRARQSWHEWVIAILFAVWPVWILDPVSRLGGFYLGHIFDYSGGGFWFGLPLLSQVGFAVVTAAVMAVLFWMTRDEPDVAIANPLRHPHLASLVIWHAQWLHMAIAALVVGSRTLGGSAFLMYIPAAGMTVVLWSTLRARPTHELVADRELGTNPSTRRPSATVADTRCTAEPVSRG